jgi:hypothetical protein
MHLYFPNTLSQMQNRFVCLSYSSEQHAEVPSGRRCIQGVNAMAHVIVVGKAAIGLRAQIFQSLPFYNMWWF